jgi:hypothetical protein
VHQHNDFLSSEPVDEEFAGETLAIAVTRLKRHGAAAEKGQSRIDAVFLNPFRVLQLGQACGNVAACQFVPTVTEHLFASLAAFHDNAPVVEDEHHQLNGINSALGGRGSRQDFKVLHR